jgi:hypothetical protein
VTAAADPLRTKSDEARERCGSGCQSVTLRLQAQNGVPSRSSPHLVQCVAQESTRTAARMRTRRPAGLERDLPFGVCHAKICGQSWIETRWSRWGRAVRNTPLDTGTWLSQKHRPESGVNCAASRTGCGTAEALQPGFRTEDTDQLGSIVAAASARRKGPENRGLG